MIKPLKHIAVTGGAGQIAYQLLFRIANGDLLGKEQPIALHILEIPEALKSLEGVAMELDDCAFPLLREIHLGSDPFLIFKDADYALLVGAKPRGPGMERKDLLADNGKIFIEQGKALNDVASKDVKVLVVGNPCNTNCLIAMRHAPKIPKKNFFAMTRLDQNRAVSQISKKAQIPLQEISHLAIWGNHSSTQVPDYEHAKIKENPLCHHITEKNWLEEEFPKIVQKRGAAVIEARGKSSAASAASAAIDTIRALNEKTSEGDCFSCAVISDGNPYNVKDGLIFSFPCRSKGNGQWEIIPGLSLSENLRKKIQLSEKELLEERDLVKDLL